MIENKIRVLIVDDEPQVAKALARLLSRRGANASVAFSATEALNQLDAVDPQIVVSDLRMPGIDGLRLLSEIRSRRPATMCVLMSGHLDVDTISGVAALSQFQVLRKPFGVDEVLRVVLGADAA